MKKNFTWLLKAAGWLLFVLAILAVVILARFTLPGAAPQPEAAGQSVAQSLHARLVRLGLPGDKLSILEKSPFELEIALQCLDGLSLQEIRWQKFLIEREAELAYLNGDTRISSYHLIVTDYDGRNIYDGTIFLSPDMPSQKLTSPPPSKISDRETEKKVLHMLNLQGLELHSLEVLSGQFTPATERLVMLTLLGDSSDNAELNWRVDTVVRTIGSTMRELNTQFGVQIAVVHLMITDKHGKLLVDFIQDLDRGNLISWVAENVDEGWIPRPAPSREERATRQAATQAAATQQAAMATAWAATAYPPPAEGAAPGLQATPYPAPAAYPTP